MGMTRKQRIFWGILSIIAFGALILGTGARDNNMDMIASTVTYTKEKEATTTTPTVLPEGRNGPLVFASIPYWDQDRAGADFKAHVAAYDIVSLFWYRLDADGGITKYRDAKEDQTLIRFSQENDVKVLALIANLPEDGDWDSERVQNVIGTPEARTAHIAAIIKLMESKGFDGINIDYEFLEDSQTEVFSAFITELAGELHAREKILAVAIHAQLARGEKRGQDLRALQAADILAFMTYDEHWETSEPGPIASLPWIREVLAYADDLDIARERIFLGLPLYGYDWPQDGETWGTAAGVEYEDVLRISRAQGSELEFNSDSMSPHFSYDTNGIFHHVWFEDVESFRAKYELAKEYRLGGVHLWRLGREDARIYEVLPTE
jgi:spore germination protein